jgi:hypothetical protein
MKTILSLYDYTGFWSRPYHDASYNVIQVDIKHGDNIFDLTRAWVKMQGPIHGILCAHPCDDFSVSGARWFAEKDADGRTAQSAKMANHTLDLIEWANPVWWVWENPVGRMNRIVPRMKQWGPQRNPNTSKVYFDPCEYGGWLNPPRDHYGKKTCLWGRFTYPVAKPVEPVILTDSKGNKGSWMWLKLGGKTEKTKELRSATPMGFAKAFFQSNP